MEIVSWNVNGLPSFVESQSYKPIEALKPDVFCIQEIRTQEKIKVLDGYYHFWNPGKRNGLFGTLTMTKIKPITIIYGMGRFMPDDEGRVLTVEFEKTYIVNCYAPRSLGGLARHEYRRKWDNALRLYFKFLQETGKLVIFCGDFNVARFTGDVYAGNERELFDKVEYLSDERSAFRKLLKTGLMDVFHHLNPKQIGGFTWWSARHNNRIENRGWRLDYFLVSVEYVENIKKMYHLSEIEGSDHSPIYLSITEPDEVDFDHSLQWRNTNWKRGEEILNEYQCAITRAALNDDWEEVARLQNELTEEPIIKKLAVRQIAQYSATPGIDNIRWTTGAEKYRAALALDSASFKASPMRQIIILDKRNGKERRMGLPIFFDRAMHVLHGYALSPVAEALDDKLSFGFRKGRSTLDVHACIMEILNEEDAPEFVLCGDVKSCYDSILHNWLIKNIPMDKHILKEMLGAGHFISGALVASDGHGLSQGSNISPIIANLVMARLQKYIYKSLGYYRKKHKRDLQNGRLVRYVDDILIFTKDIDTAKNIKKMVERFLKPRGLELSPEKTYISSITEKGFTFLGRKYKREDYYVNAEPSDQAVKRFIKVLEDTIERGEKKSQRELIASLNRKLKGWANYHRITDALSTFKHIDNVLEVLLAKAVTERHPKMQKAKVLERYFFKDHKGRHIFALKNDKAIKVIRLEDILLVKHQPLDYEANYYLNRKYFEDRLRESAIQNVNAIYRPIWERQEGRCLYCGNKIMPDQDRTLVPIDYRIAPSLKNSAYIHKLCETHEFDLIGTMESPEELSPFKIMGMLQDLNRIENKEPLVSKHKPKDGAISWVHHPLKRFFALSVAPRITITFEEIENIEGRKLHPASLHEQFWQEHKIKPSIALAWVSEGYELESLDLDNETITLRRVNKKSLLNIPRILTDTKLPTDAQKELENFFEHIIKKYGLDGGFQS